VNRTVEKIERLSLALLVVGTLIGWAASLVHVPSFLAGGLIMQINFWLLKKIVALLLFRSEGHQPGRRSAVFLIISKGAIFLLLLSAMFIRYPIEPLSFMAGVSLLVLTCMIVTLFDSWNGSRVAVSEK
jgi:uncharacterized membrane protein YeaQ/YmgE (transglycosylase-associated protein family)